ncbi:Hsp70 family protein [Streptomyces sp. NPDC051954]|uniref:Hsp70 family protein n=1 Tax=unclassified Streptomyces TaxID=2593676 RepID=UPI003441B73E
MAAVDFGTHGSGFAWCAIDRINDIPSDRKIFYFDQWRKQPVVYPKNLSALLLDGKGTVLDWGYSARRALSTARAGGAAPSPRLVQGFKMWLRGGDDPVAGHLNGTPAQALPLITAYLERLRKVAVRHITDGGYQENEIRWCLTVPAMWTDYQRDAMRKCAQKAGFPSTREQLLLITEPEAAAIHALVRIPSGRTSSPIMMVDCGGGTIDISAYLPGPNRHLAQLGHTTGGHLGSAYINERFLATVVRPRLGPDLVDELERTMPAAVQDMMDAFENAKMHHDAGRTERLSVSIPGQVYRLLLTRGRLEHLARMQGGEDFHIALDAKAADSLFEGVVRPLLYLVSERIVELRGLLPDDQKKIKVVVVGGFAQSPYLRTRLTEFLGERYGTDVQVIIPPDPARTVLAGAVHYAYEPEVVTSRTVGFTYGVECWLPFEEDVDPPRLRSRTDDGRTMCRDRFLTFTQIGESVEVDQEITQTLLPLLSDQEAVEFGFYASTEKTPRYISRNDARLLGSITIELGGAMKVPLDERAIDITLRFGGTEIEATALNQHTGQRMRTSLAFSPDTGS